MDEVLPLELTHTFNCQIISSQLIVNLSNRAFYKCATNFGTMTLIVQYLHSHSDTISLSCHSINHCQMPSGKGLIQNLKQIFERRNHFLNQYPFSTFIPVIYEQHIIMSHKNRSTCLTLTEPIKVVTIEECKEEIRLQKQKNLILSLFLIENNSSRLNLARKQSQMVFCKSVFSDSILIDFTQLNFVQEDLKLELMPKQQQIREFCLKFYPSQRIKTAKSREFKEIILIKDQIYGFSVQKMLKRPFKSYFELAICLNFLSDYQIFLKVNQSKNEDKKTNIKKMKLKDVSSTNSEIPIEFYHSQAMEISSHFHFYDNYCVDLLQPIQYEQLIERFFVDNSCYLLKKSVYLEVERTTSIKKHQTGDTIYIEENVSKSQCINFLITYCKFITPTLQKISFQHESNTLTFQFLGKLKVSRKLRLVFHPNYIVKDEELSMIIQKSKLQKVTVKLSQMQITDSFLMFLANSQKMSKIIELDISYCKKITENGVNSLLISPYCKKLQILNVSGTPVTQYSIQSLLSKTKLKQLMINHCFAEDFHQEVFSFKNSNLIRLQALGMKVSPFFSSSISILKIDIQVPFDFLKQLKDMPLKQLRVKLVQQKKNLIGGFLGTIGNFYTKQINPIKIFAQGRSSKTLKSIDLSGSNAKLKNVKNLFYMPQIEIVILEDISASQQIDFIISPKILQLSIKNSMINAKELFTLLKNTKIMMKLNVSLSNVKKQEIKELIFHTKKFINTLIISENQYSLHLIDPNGKVSEYVQTFQITCKEQFFKPKNQKIISAMIMKTLKGNKNLKIQLQNQSSNKQNQIKNQAKTKEFECKAMKYLGKIISFQNKETVNNIFINDKPFRMLFGKEARSNKKIGTRGNCQQFVGIHNQKLKRQRVYKLQQNSLSFQYQLNKQIKGQKQFSDDQHYTVTHFTYIYKKAVIQNPNSQIEVSLANNKVINCENAFKIITGYGPSSQIKMINMRGATLFSPQLFYWATQIPHLQSFNHNQYQIVFDGHDFVNLSQKYLKFFMRISSVKKLRLSCKNIFEVDILSSIMFHILDSHYQTIQSLDCTFENVKMNSENSFSFWTKISQLRTSFLRLKFIKYFFRCFSCPTAFLKDIFKEHLWNQERKLQTLVLEGIDYQSLPILKEAMSLKSVALVMEGSKISEGQLIKFLKMLGSSMKKLSMNLNECEGMIHPNRLFAAIENLKDLEKLRVSFQYCPLKELSTLDFMENIYNLKGLKQVELDFSYTSIRFGSISNIVGNFPHKLPNCHFVIYSLGNQSKQVIFDQEGLSNQGVQVLL